jgi:hypothetical protein
VLLRLRSAFAAGMFGITTSVAAVNPNTATIAKIANIVLFIVRKAGYILYKDLLENKTI